MACDGQPVAGMQRDAAGSTFVTLYSPEAEAGALVPIVTEGKPGSHTLRLTVAEASDPASAGHAVTIDAFEVSSEQDADAALVPVVVSIAGMALAIVLLLTALRRVGVVRPRERA